MSILLRDNLSASSSTLSWSPRHQGPENVRFYGDRSTGQRREVIFSAGFPPLEQAWLAEAVRVKLNALLSLEAGWDGFRAAAISDVAATQAMRIIFAIAHDTVLAPQIFPLPDGGLQIEWHAGGYSVEIEVSGVAEAHFLAVNDQDEVALDEEWGPDGPGDLLRLVRVMIQRMTTLVAQSG